MREKWGVGLGLLAFVVILGCCLAVSSRIAPEKNPRSSASKTFSRDIAQDFTLRRHGLYGVDLIRCASCRIRKRKIGMLTLGGFNVLELKNLEIVIPPEPAVTNRASTEAPASSNDQPAQEILSSLGLPQEFLRTQGLPMKFSGLVIDWLAVSRLDGTNVVAWFSATRAEAQREGLRLEGLVVDGQGVGAGWLKKGDRLKLVYADHEIGL